MPTHDHVPVAGSERTPLPGAHEVSAARPDERLEVTVLVRSRAPSGLPSIEELGARAPLERQHLTRKEFAAEYGADPADLELVEAFARANGLEVVGSSAARRSVVLSGTVAAMSQAFGTRLARYEHPGGAYRGRTGPVHVPAELAPIVEGVFGLDDRPQARPHLRRRRALGGTHAAGRAYAPTEVARLYDFPAGLDGHGQCIGILEFGGGFRPAALRAYFAELGIPAPRVSAVSVDGARSRPGANADEDTEVMLDIEVAGAVAPGARVVVYFSRFTERGWVDAIRTAVHDARTGPSVISISWGYPEEAWTAQARSAVDQALQEAAAMGVTVCCASGDDGSADQVDDGLAHVDFPASSPHILGCGGTRLEVARNAIAREVVWNEGPGAGATGGGVSSTFPLPAWQRGVGVPRSANPGGGTGRGVPDVAGDADPATGYRIRVDGGETVVGGTSAVAPLWAGLIALLNQRLGRSIGYLNPLLYARLGKAGALRDVTSGSNGAYRAGPGWDACTGFGSPDGAKLLRALGG